MTIRNRFIKFCLAQQNAEELLRTKGPESAETKTAFQTANELKLSVQNALEEIEAQVQE